MNPYFLRGGLALPSLKSASILFLLLLLPLVFLVPPSSGGELYKWKDKNGTTHFSDSPPDGPPPKKVEAWDMPSDPGGNPEILTGIESSGGDAPVWKAPPSVVIYTTPWCKYCKKAKTFLNEMKVPYTEYDIESHPEADAKMKLLNPKGSVPTAVINGQILVGFGQDQWARALRNVK